MAKIEIRCPYCDLVGNINVEDNAFKNVARGLLAVDIDRGVLCSHTFIAYVDMNFQVRDYFIADFKVETPEIPSIKNKIKGGIPKKEIVDLNLIKLTFPATLMSYVFKSIFFRQKIIIISDQEFLNDHIKNFFKFITEKTFETEILVISPEDYKKNKKHYKKSMVFNGVKILNNIQKLINKKKIHVENSIVNKFLVEKDLEVSFIILKNEVYKAFELSKSIANFIKESQKKNEIINILKINLELKKNYGIKINDVYLKFLTEIVKYYYHLPVPSFVDGFFDIL